MEPAELFKKIGIDEKTAGNIAKNKNITNLLTKLIEGLGYADTGCDRGIGNLLYALAGGITQSMEPYILEIGYYIRDGKIKNSQQLKAALAFVKNLPSGEKLSHPEFSEACGVGIEITNEEIRTEVDKIVNENANDLTEQRYQYNTAHLLCKLREGHLKWSNGKDLKDCLDAAILKLIGPRNEEDEKIAKNKKKGKNDNKDNKQTDNTNNNNNNNTTNQTLIADGFEARDMSSLKNSTRLLEEHKQKNGDMILTRFPPEPNGYLHIGHAKSIYLNFKYAFEKAGKPGQCIFRLDDTNPEAEDIEYIDSITEDVRWLGWTPCKTTYSSDYFQELFDYAIILIKKGKAFVCNQTKDEMKACREMARELNTPGGRRDLVPESPYRNRTVEENLRLFYDMKKGKFGEGEAVLRLKMNMRDVNPCMWDPVAYRIKYLPHPHVGDKWCIYPSYDFSHCLIDSLEQIDYSLCTLEFETRRQTYYWLLEELDIWRPYVWEFGRLNLTNTVMSKRKLKFLVMNKHVRGWDDPRMPTLRGFRRRGYTMEAINRFCETVSVTRSADTTSDVKLLENILRLDLDNNCTRGFCVLDPIKLIIDNYDDKKVETISIPNHPKRPELGKHDVYFQKVVYIDRNDYKNKDEPKYLGLAPGKLVGLKYAHDIVCTGCDMTPDGAIECVHANLVTPEEAEKIYATNNIKKKGNVHWVCGKEGSNLPTQCECRLYNHLFKEENPSGLGDDWIKHVNMESEIIVTTAYIDDYLLRDHKKDSRYQFERVGYFIVDQDTKPSKIVFNRILPLTVEKK